MHLQPGFFDLSDRYEALSKAGDPLEKLNEVIDWKVFLPLLTHAFTRVRKSPAGRKPYSRLLMFKILVLQSLYNISDHQTEYQIRDRLSFMRFLGLNLESRIPDEKTIWLFRETLIEGKVIDKLFQRFNRFLEKQGLSAECGTIIDASIVEAPRQRNSREDNKRIKAGDIPEKFKKNKHVMSHKDVDARWTRRQADTYYGYKDHIGIDTKHKLIRTYEVTTANVSDTHCFEKLLDENNSSNLVWADNAYFSEKNEAMLESKGFKSKVTKRYGCHYAVGTNFDRENRRRSKIRKRVEHAFGIMANSMGGKFVRTIGLIRAQAKIGLMNLVHNLLRYEQICRIGVS